MKRHQALVPLSHQHQAGLNAALHLERIGTDKARMTPLEALRTFVLFWERDGNANFRFEEELLIPHYSRFASVNDETIVKVLTDHARLRAMALTAAKMERGTLYEGLERSGAGLDEELLHKLGAGLREHIRFEQRDVYPLYEEILPESVLAEIGRQLPDTRWYSDG